MFLILDRGKEIMKKGDVKSGSIFVECYSLYFLLVKGEYYFWVDLIFGYKVEMIFEGRRDVFWL